MISLSILKKDKTKIDINGSKIILKGGQGISVLEDQNESISFTTVATSSEGNKGVLQKWEDIKAGTGNWSGVPYYLSKINSQASLEGTFFLNQDECMHIYPYAPTEISPETSTKLNITNICYPSVDCREFSQFFDYIKIIENYIKGYSTNIWIGADSIWSKYRRLIEYYNKQIHDYSFRYYAETSGEEVNASCSYNNQLKDETISGTLEIEFTGGGISGVADVARAFPVDYIVSSEAIQVNINQDYLGDVGAKKIIVDISNIAPGEGFRFYAGCLVNRVRKKGLPDVALPDGILFDGGDVKVNFKFMDTAGIYSTKFKVVNVAKLREWDESSSSIITSSYTTESLSTDILATWWGDDSEQ